MDEGNNFERLATSPFQDVVVHSTGSKFIVDGIEHNAQELASILSGNGSPIRLLSCNNLESAQELSAYLGREVIANGGLTRIHIDGHISVVAKNGSGTDWFRVMPNRNMEPHNVAETATQYADDFVEMGAAPVIKGFSALCPAGFITRFEGLGFGIYEVKVLFSRLDDDVLKVEKVLNSLEANKGIANFGDLVEDLKKVEGEALLKKIGELDEVEGERIIITWNVLKDTPLRYDVDNWIPRISGWLDEGLEIGIKESDGIIRIFGGGNNPIESGLEIARVSNKNGDEVLEILEDGFLPLTYPSSGAIVSSKGIDLPVVAPCQSSIPNVSLARMSNGKIGFMADLSQYKSALVQKALTSPYYHLRKILESNGLVSAGQQAHHVIPIGLLRNNRVVQDAVEAGFDFNGLVNGKGLRSVGENPIHLGSHDNYNVIVEQKITKWFDDAQKAGTYSAENANNFLSGLANNIKKTLDDFPDTPVNQLVF